MFPWQVVDIVPCACPPGEVLKLSQFSKGVDDRGHLLVDVVVSGNVPDIDPSNDISLAPYTEQYTQTGPGMLS